MTKANTPFSDRFSIVPVMLRYEASSIDMNKYGYVYILASQRNGTLYIGVTSNLSQRMEKHKNGYIEGFTKKYKIHTLVYYEIFEQFTEALVREKVLKGITRKRKLEIIEQYNPQLKDLTLAL